MLVRVEQRPDGFVELRVGFLEGSSLIAPVARVALAAAVHGVAVLRGRLDHVPDL